MKNNLTLKFSIIGIILIVINFIIIGGGHGFYEPLFFLFPIPCMVLIFNDECIFFIIALLFLQFPFYGFIIEKFSPKYKYTALLLFVFHIILGIIAVLNIPVGFK